MSNSGIESLKKINFHFKGIKKISLDYQGIRLVVAKIFASESKFYSHVDIILTTDDEILKMNRHFLQHDFYTDILTFKMNEKSEIINGEIYISIDRVKENAQNFNVKIKEELLRVIIHGNLHLCGYSDHTSKLKILMTDKENYYLLWYNKEIVSRETIKNNNSDVS